MSWARALKVELVPGPKLGPSEKIDPRIFYSIKALVLLKMSTEQPEPSLGSDSLLHFSVQLYINMMEVQQTQIVFNNILIISSKFCFIALQKCQS